MQFNTINFVDYLRRPFFCTIQCGKLSKLELNIQRDDETVSKKNCIL